MVGIPSICCLNREKRIRAAWPFVIPSWLATRVQSIYQGCISGLEGGYCRAMVRRYVYRFQIQLLYDGIEELGGGAIRGHKLISS